MSWAIIRRKLASTALLFAVIGAVVLVPAMPASAATTSSEEIDFVNKLNNLRASHGLRTLAVDYRLRNVARNWSQRMANDGFISHNPSLAGQLPSEWRSAAENVGVGGTVQALHDAFVASPHHYDNMVNGTFHAVGIGVVHTDTRIWVTVNFMYSGKSTPADPEAGAVSNEVTPTWVTYRAAASNGRIFGASADVQQQSMGMKLNRPIVGTAVTPTRQGQWTVGSDGGVFTFGDAGFYGSTGAMRLNQPVVGMAPTKTGRGYWLVASDGGIFAFGDAQFHGSTGAMRLNQPIVGMAATPSGNGYWLVARDGGIFTFGNAQFFGSMGGANVSGSIVGMAATPTGKGYVMVSNGGGVYTFGDAVFEGSISYGAAITAISS